MDNWATFYQIDAFTTELFHGNPAVICIMPTDLDDKIYLTISSEMNLSETAFLEETESGVYKLRWFTPVKEVPLCGHATLAASHLLFNYFGVDLERIQFDTKSGVLFAENTSDGVLMDFPSNPPEPVEHFCDVLDALGVDEWIDVQYSPGNQKLMVHLESYDILRDVEMIDRDIFEEFLFSTGSHNREIEGI